MLRIEGVRLRVPLLVKDVVLGPAFPAGCLEAFWHLEIGWLFPHRKHWCL